MRIRLTIEYNGAGYSGWQFQPDLRTVQGEIESALKCAVGADIRIHGSGRTDAGVHAYAQTAHFDTDADIPADKWPYVLNELLPPDITILSSGAVPDTFHARFSAVGKTYIYRMYVSEQPSALRADTHLHIVKRPDTALMREAAAYFIGTHDFRAFISAGTTVAKSTVRTISRIDICEEGDEISISVTGNAFLYNQVRVMAAQLLRAGYGTIKPEGIAAILASLDRRQAREILSAKGLYLDRVYY